MDIYDHDPDPIEEGWYRKGSIMDDLFDFTCRDHTEHNGMRVYCMLGWHPKDSPHLTMLAKADFHIWGPNSEPLPLDRGIDYFL